MTRLVRFYGVSPSELWWGTPVWQWKLLTEEMDALLAEEELRDRGATAYPHMEKSAASEDIMRLRMRVMDGMPIGRARIQRAELTPEQKAEAAAYYEGIGAKVQRREADDGDRGEQL